MVGCVIYFDKIEKCNLEWKVVVLVEIEHCFEDKQAILTSKLKCATKLESVTQRIEEFECRFVHN
jgi:hypothetical protein